VVAPRYGAFPPMTSSPDLPRRGTFFDSALIQVSGPATVLKSDDGAPPRWALNRRRLPQRGTTTTRPASAAFQLPCYRIKYEIVTQGSPYARFGSSALFDSGQKMTHHRIGFKCGDEPTNNFNGDRLIEKRSGLHPVPEPQQPWPRLFGRGLSLGSGQQANRIHGRARLAGDGL